MSRRHECALIIQPDHLRATPSFSVRAPDSNTWGHHSRLPALWYPDVPGTWLSMGNRVVGIPNPGHAAVPVHILQVRGEN